MLGDLYSKLTDLALLRRAWHLARNDSRTDFMADPFRYSDFGFSLDDYLTTISKSLADGSYHPKPLLTIDVPKSTLAVRPGSVLAIEDRIVLFAIACLMAPNLDKRLPDGVYSCRVKKKADKIDLFHDHEILKFPFLKRKTIVNRLDIIEPWYALWPRFIQKLTAAYEEEGYKILVVSDIVAYFENIDLGLLRDILNYFLPRQARIINFLIKLLQFWEWPTVHGSVSTRGIPQGNGVSSFLGNIYLLPIDRAFVSLSKRLGIKYLRYMDDIKVLAKDMPSAREALFLMNERLRTLRLNIQASKTRILQGEEIADELFDNRMDGLEEIIRSTQKKEEMTKTTRQNYIQSCRALLRKVKKRRGIIRDKELRLFRRLMTAFALLGHSGMVKAVLDQLQKNPDNRLLANATNYFRIKDRDLKRVPACLTKMLQESQSLFPYQTASFLIMLRFVGQVPDEAWDNIWCHVRGKDHWYVRQQAALLISMRRLAKNSLDAIQRLFEKEQEIEVKRAWVRALAQVPIEDLGGIVRSLLLAVDQKLQRLGRFYHGLLTDKTKGMEQIKSLFSNFSEEVFLERLHEVEVLSKAEHREVKEKLMKNLRVIIGGIRRPLIKERVQVIVSTLNTTCNGQTS
jgi:Reverse transcriptase (RNA-dependent DNA polymerase)